MNEKFDKLIKEDVCIAWQYNINTHRAKITNGYLWDRWSEEERVINTNKIKYDSNMTNITTIIPFRKNNYVRR